jgi:hypothetical protein
MEFRASGVLPGTPGTRGDPGYGDGWVTGATTLLLQRPRLAGGAAGEPAPKQNIKQRWVVGVLGGRSACTVQIPSGRPSLNSRCTLEVWLSPCRQCISNQARKPINKNQKGVCFGCGLDIPRTLPWHGWAGQCPTGLLLPSRAHWGMETVTLAVGRVVYLP